MGEDRSGARYWKQDCERIIKRDISTKFLGKYGQDNSDNVNLEFSGYEYILVVCKPNISLTTTVDIP